jgi:hypothetical protein
VAEDEDAFGLQMRPCTTVATRPFHKIILLGHRRKLSPADDAPLNRPKQLIYFRLAMTATRPRLRVKNAASGHVVELQEQVRREMPMTGPQPTDAQSANR